MYLGFTKCGTDRVVAYPCLCSLHVGQELLESLFFLCSADLVRVTAKNNASLLPNAHGS